MNSPFAPPIAQAARSRSDTLPASRNNSVGFAKSLQADDLPMLRPPAFSRRALFDTGRMPTIRECRPHRPRPQPRWFPSRRHLVEAESVPVGFRPKRVLLKAATDLGPTRINFSYNNHGSTSANFCEKPGRQQFCEGPHEVAWLRWASVNVYCTDFQFQPTKASFIDEHGNMVTAFWDVAFEFIDGTLAFAEIKADRSFFRVPSERLIIEASAATLRSHNIAFLRLHGTDFDPLIAQRIKHVFDRRRTIYDPEGDVERVLVAIENEGGALPLGRATEILGGGAAAAEAKLCAMMVARHVSIDLEQPLTPTSLVQSAPAATHPAALRRFLRQIAEEDQQ